MRMASSTARRLSTGSEPGRPSVTGSMLVLGSSPKRFGLPLNSLVAVASSTWTSRPDDELEAVDQRRRSPRGLADRQLGGRHARSFAAASSAAATRYISGSPRAGARTCTPTGRPPSPVPNGTLMAGWPASGEGMV